jgi:intracellular sulfur oxidation DsrE/DsrF family protein
MRIRNSICLFGLTSLILFTLGACSVKNQVEAEVKKLDSLRIVLNSKLSELSKSDTAMVSRAILKFTNYSIFIENNLSDTITKTQANGLQQFYVSGNSLKAFAVNRSSIITRASFVNAQIKNLMSDLTNGLLNKETFLKNYDAESKAAIQLIVLSEQELIRYTQSIQDFKNAISPVEALIKSHNNGLLPEAIKDSNSI